MMRHYSLCLVLCLFACDAFYRLNPLYCEDNTSCEVGMHCELSQRACVSGGLALTASGLLLAVWRMDSQAWVMAGMFLITLGELMLGAVAQYTLMRLTPGRKNAGFYYSLGLSLMQVGKTLGAVLAFPLLIHAQSLGRFTALVLAAVAALMTVLFLHRAEIVKQAA